MLMASLYAILRARMVTVMTPVILTGAISASLFPEFHFGSLSHFPSSWPGMREEFSEGSSAAWFALLLG